MSKILPGGNEDPPYSLVGKYPKVRYCFGIVVVALGLMLAVDGVRELGPLAALPVACFLIGGIGLFTRFWVSAVSLWYLGLGALWILDGLSTPSHQTFRIGAGSLMCLLVLAQAVIALQALVRRRRRAQEPTTDN